MSAPENYYSDTYHSSNLGLAYNRLMDILLDDSNPNRRRILELGVTFGSLLAVAAINGCTNHHEEKPPTSFNSSAPNPEIKSGQMLDLLANQAWSMAGVEQRGDGSLHINYENMKIVKKDGTAGQDNPPINLFGMHLNINDFSLVATLDFADYLGESAITLYGRPPIIYDEERYDDKTLRIALQKDSFWVGLINGELGQDPVIEKNYTIDSGTSAMINVVRQGGYVTFCIITGEVVKTLGSIPEAGLFDSGELWFGLDANSPGGWTLKEASITPLSGGMIEVIDTSRYTPVSKEQDSLNVLAEKKRSGFNIGAAVALEPIVSDAAYAKLMLGGNFGIVTPENAMKFQFIHPQPDQYSFQAADALVEIAEHNGMKVHGHTLDFAEANPRWVHDIAKHHPDQLQRVLEDHIATVVDHYGDRVMDWDVINEPLVDYGATPGLYGLRKSIWYEAMGPDHIEIALKAAHQANANARLWINEFGLEADDNRFADMLALLRRLKSNDAPLYGVGLQAHISDNDTINSGQSIDKEKLRQRIRLLADLGVKARISELDVDHDREQGIFAEILEVCIGESNCSDVTLWGATDKYSSSGGLNSKGQLTRGIGLPWDARQQPRAAVLSMKQVLTTGKYNTRL